MDRVEKAQSTHGAGVLCIKNERVLLVKMNYGKFKGEWILPGGMVESGEHPHIAAVREFKEESNLDIKLLELLTVRYRSLNDRTDNTYWVFTGELDDHVTEHDLDWDEKELQDVKFWSIDSALKASTVRPHTKYYVQLYLKQIESPKIKQMQGPYSDFCYQF